jgi:hypothetical protein
MHFHPAYFLSSFLVFEVTLTEVRQSIIHSLPSHLVTQITKAHLAEQSRAEEERVEERASMLNSNTSHDNNNAKSNARKMHQMQQWYLCKAR